MFTRLRLTGFKSFVEATEFAIEPGLTGIVGPNGCGKSNLVEALRWVMGETSAKKMRGGAMDDVIFAGTATRAARNLAEVSLHLDNIERLAPAAFNDAAELEITRRIEREQGSAYRINGREVRARDVQLLFADLATGAGSTAMVSQGRVGALINAKPTERRGLLEEAAGISGLHSRRHEAELRLKAAESNLERLDDVTQQLDTQLQGLKRQARQANRYRNLSGLIRHAEAIQFHLRYLQSSTALAKAQAQLAETERLVAQCAAQAAAASTAEANAAEALPPLRQDEAETAAALHRLNLAREGLEAEERRAREQQAQLEARLAQNAADHGRERGHQQDAAGAIARLEGEAAELTSARQGEAALESTAQAKADDLAAQVSARQKTLDQLTEQAAQQGARRNALNQQLVNLGQRIQRLDLRAREIAAEQQRLTAEGDDIALAEAAGSRVEQAQTQTEAARGRLEAMERARAQAQTAENAAREVLQERQGAVGRLSAEEKGLSRLLAVSEDDLWPPLIDAVAVETGFEASLGAALGEDLSASGDAAAPAHWAVLPALEQAAALPEGATPLSRHVQAPPALARRLSQIGIVNQEDGPRLQSSLRPGQRLVSREGDLWRWDGFVRRAGAPSPAAVRLAQRNRLADLRDQLLDAEKRLNTAREAFESARAAAQAAVAAEGEARTAVRTAERDLATARDSQAAAVQKAAARASRLSALATSAEQIAADLAESRGQQTDAQTQLAALPAEQVTRDALAQIRPELEGLRNGLAEARGALDQLRRDAAARARRAAAIKEELQAWTSRRDGAERQLAQLAERQQALEAELGQVRTLPAEIATKRVALLDEISKAEERRRAAADALAVAEAQAAECARGAKATQAALAEGRELRVRAEADVEHSRDSLNDLAGRIRETMECAPDEVLAKGEVSPDEAMPELSAIDSRLERLKKERDGMGPVNLRAEIESREVEEQLTTLQSERADLEAAIARLRQGIASLNREGRERLLDAFKQVDAHFQELFVTVFGGGRAHLALTESDDPLQAGLEIMASPPGKKLQVMSLLSGGEQALTALSLLFAVFLTNPAPICVLDEVDAPLDDANVERLCDLLDRIVKSGNTRFLVVTHHPITMARMDRLFGVTMAERGISQLVSVDLSTAESFRQTA